jgi:hypothetical protein
MVAFGDMEKPSEKFRVHRYRWMNKDRVNHWFICPGCKKAHAFDERWDFNGDYEKPTFSPSLLCTGRKRCHSFVRDGNIQFLSDCDHDLAGQTVPILPWRDDQIMGED